ncbi:MAG: OmpA family protein [Rhizobiaceae bacterium]|nr:OmpA family protein [Rhizobiaceae bacterium]
MITNRTIAAGTALALLMTAPIYTVPVSAAPFHAGVPAIPQSQTGTPPLVLAQASIEELRRRLEEEELTEEERIAIEEQIEALEAAADEEAPPAEEPAAEETAPEEPAAEEAAPEEEPEVEEPAPADEPTAEEEAPAEEPPAEEAPAAEEPVEEEPAEEEAVPAEEPAVEAEEAPAEESATEEAPAAEDPVAEEPAAEEETPAEAPPAEEEPATEEPVEEEPAAEEAAPAEEPAAEEQAPAEEPAEEESAPAEDDSAAAEEEDVAPVLDSQKETDVSGEAAASGEASAEAEAEQAPPPESDEAAQAEAAPAPDEVESATADEGTRVEASQAEARVEQRSDAQVIGEIAGRLILSLAGRQVVGHDDRERLRRGAEEVYYEELRRGRTRETIIRPNGTRIVTIRDRYGDIIRRSRITPDGREYILVYAGDRDDDDGRRGNWRDPGRDLPPLRLRIPAREYILDARRVEDPDRYYEFLDQPPVERVRRLYSLDEVKYSARVRDSVRRVDLDNITFDFGSASISESEIAKLEGLANAMARLLDENPAETFLIEGHTDAVGTETANLSLSDRRAETVARALTEVFEIPPENLVTQGYGEAYLKVNTQEPNRTNRRVAVRRITPLVAPVAANQ